MINHENILSVDIKEVRNKAFYLLKKYTSYRILEINYLWNKEFVEAFERQLRHPSSTLLSVISEYDQNQHEQEFIRFLKGLSSKERGLKQLLTSPYKNEAYDTFWGDSGGTLFGRYADEQGLAYDIFYQNLGLGKSSAYIYDPYDHTAFVEKVVVAGELIGLAAITLFDVEYRIPNKHKIYNKWSYESLFSEDYWPPVKEIVKPIENCPDYNLSSLDEILSGAEIVISGIYEPWFKKPVYEKLTLDPNYNPYVGCPNYFLNGTIATQYKLEGTEDWYDVKWRLIWEDNRYLDGTIPEEEKSYTFDLENIGIKAHSNIETTEKLSIRAGQVCSKTGYWFTVAQENSRQYFKQGEVLPEIKNQNWGEVYWQFDGE